MDTQAMTYGGKNTPSDIEAQRAKIPDVKPKEINIISDALKKELHHLKCLVKKKHRQWQKQDLLRRQQWQTKITLPMI